MHSQIGFRKSRSGIETKKMMTMMMQMKTRKMKKKMARRKKRKKLWIERNILKQNGKKYRNKLKLKESKRD